MLSLLYLGSAALPIGLASSVGYFYARWSLWGATEEKRREYSNSHRAYGWQPRQELLYSLFPFILFFMGGMLFSLPSLWFGSYFLYASIPLGCLVAYHLGKDLAPNEESSGASSTGSAGNAVLILLILAVVFLIASVIFIILVVTLAPDPR
jgi:hypothetical protein